MIKSIGRVIIICTAFCIICANSGAQGFSSKLNESLFYIFNLNYEKADSSNSTNNNLVELNYARHYSLFIQYSLGELEYDSFINQSDLIFDELKDNSQDSDLYESELHLQVGIVEYQNQNYLSSIRHFNKGYNLWKNGNNNLYNYKKLSGIYNILLSQLPEPYINWAEWFGFSGSLNKGFDTLNEYFLQTKDLEGYQMEAALYLSFCHLKFTNDPDVITSFIQQIKNKATSEFLQSIIIRCSYKSRCPHLLNDWLTKALGTDSFIQLYYLQGKNYTQINNPLAPARLKYFIENSPSNTFKADALRYLSWHYLLNKDTALYTLYQNKIATIEKPTTFEDKQAIYENSLNLTPNPILLKGRLLFDNGRYEECIQTLLSHQDEFINDPTNRLEYHYRLGRSYDCNGAEEKALLNYLFAVKNQSNNQRYFPPYAAIYACRIYVRKNNVEQAKKLIQELKRMDIHEEKAAIQREIKTLETDLDNTINR